MILSTYQGDAHTENVPLESLAVGDTVLGIDTQDGQPRTVHRVTAAFGEHHVPVEGPLAPVVNAVTRWTGEKETGVLVVNISAGSPGMFTSATTPTLDRVTSWCSASRLSTGAAGPDKGPPREEQP